MKDRDSPSKATGVKGKSKRGNDPELVERCNLSYYNDSYSCRNLGVCLQISDDPYPNCPFDTNKE